MKTYMARCRIWDGEREYLPGDQVPAALAAEAAEAVEAVDAAEAMDGGAGARRGSGKKAG